MDSKYEQLAAGAQLAVGVFLSDSDSDYAFVEFGYYKALSVDAQRKCVPPGMRFVGVAALVDGDPQSALAEPLDEAVVDALAKAFVKLLMQLLDSQIKQDEEWAKKDPPTAERLEELMAQPVWVLSVDLQTKTATFQTGMADAAKSARGAFTDIKSGSNEMGSAVSGHMSEARHGVMMLGEEFGVHLPRGLTTFIASLGPVGAAMEAAFPFLAIILGATLLLEHLASLHAAGEKLTEDQAKFGISAQNAFNALDKKILEAELRTDELRGDHLGALEKQLQIINLTSMDELQHSFLEVAKGADELFAQLQSHWYTFGSGSEGAKHSLTEFQTQYEALLSKKDDKGASDLLQQKLDRETRILEMQKQRAASMPKRDGGDGNKAKFNEADIELKKLNAKYDEDATKSQQVLVDALNEQLGVQQRLATLKQDDVTNAKLSEAHRGAEEAQRAAKEKQEAMKRAQEEAKRLQEEAQRARIEAIDQGEREAIDATDQGSAARLAAIDAAIKEEEAANLKGTSYYKDLLQQRIELVRHIAEEEAKLRSDAAREAADNEQKMGELAIAAEKQRMDLQNSIRSISEKLRVAQEQKIADEEFALKQKALVQESAALDKGGKDYENKLKQIQDRQKQLVMQHENEITAIKNKALQEQNQKTETAMRHMQDTMSSSLTQVLMGHKSFASQMNAIGDQVVSGMMKSALMSAMTMDIGKEKEAAAAARKMFLAGAKFPFPANIVMAPAMGAMAFASVMAFNEGGVVPGIGNGDTVPAMLTPGEGVIPKDLMEGLSSAARGGGMGGGHTHNFHYRPTFHVQTIDGDGVRGMLDKHTNEFSRHFQNETRKMNR